MLSYKKILPLIVFSVCIISFNLIAQNDVESLLKIEKENYLRDQEIAKIAYPGDSTIDVTYYKLNLKITYVPNYLIGVVTVNAKSTSPSLSSFFLDLQNKLRVDSIISQVKKLNFSQSTSKLNITLDKTLSYGQSFSIKIYYQGVPGSSGFGSFEFGSHNSEPSIWSLSEPYGASDWWPCKDTPADKADSSDVWITCNSALTGVSNGILTAVVNNGDNTYTYKWKNRYPIAQYLISVAISNYRKYTTYFHYTKTDSMPVENFVYPEDFQTNKKYIDKTTNMLKIFSERYGLYPFIKEKYGQVQFGWSGGMEHQTITSLGGFGESIQAHELSHQWFGDKVTCADWNDIWLNEGFAAYSEAVYFEAIDGETGYENYMQNIMKSAKLAQGSIYVKDISSVNNIFNYSRTYEKGATVLYMLRNIVGDSTFFKILRTYLDDPKLAYNVATTADFERNAEKVYGGSLNYFFNEWIYGENFPKYTFKWNMVKNSDNSATITANVSQEVNTNPKFFTMPIELKIFTMTGDTVVTVFNNQKNQNFQIKINGIPKYILFDPDDKILKDISIIDSIDLTKPVSFSLEQNYPNPFNPTTKIKYSIPVLDKGYVPVNLTVYDVEGRKVATLVNGMQSAGNYQVEFPSKNLNKKLASGIYIYTLKAGNYTSSKKMILLK